MVWLVDKLGILCAKENKPVDSNNAGVKKANKHREEDIDMVGKFV